VDAALAAREGLRLGLPASWVSEVAPLFSFAEDNAASERRTSRALIDRVPPGFEVFPRAAGLAASVRQVDRSSRCAVKRTVTRAVRWVESPVEHDAHANSVSVEAGSRAIRQVHVVVNRLQKSERIGFGSRRARRRVSSGIG